MKRHNLAKPLNSLSPKRPGAKRSMFGFYQEMRQPERKKAFSWQRAASPPGFALPKGQFSGSGGRPLFLDQRRHLCLSRPATPPVGPGRGPRDGDCRPVLNSGRSGHLQFLAGRGALMQSKSPAIGQTNWA